MTIDPQSLHDVKITLKMRCEDCGHIQIVHGHRYDGHNYFGSAYNWCNECETGLPKPIEPIKVKEE